MMKVVLVVVAFAVAICTPWFVAASDISSNIHLLPGGWNVMLMHSNVIIHTPGNRPFWFSLKEVFVSAALVVLIVLILIAAKRQQRLDAPGFDVQQRAEQTADPGSHR